MERFFRTVEPTAGFSERILQTVETKHEAWRRRERSVFGVVAITLLLAFVLSLLVTVRAFVLSDFGGYASLLFSDSRAIFAYWKAFSFGLVEALPAGTLFLVLGVFCALLWAARRFSRPSSRPIRYRALS